MWTNWRFLNFFQLWAYRLREKQWATPTLQEYHLKFANLLKSLLTTESSRVRIGNKKGLFFQKGHLSGDSRNFLEILEISKCPPAVQNLAAQWFLRDSRDPVPLSEHLIAGNRRKPQEPAENRRLAFVPLGSSLTRGPNNRAQTEVRKWVQNGAQERKKVPQLGLKH